MTNSSNSFNWENLVQSNISKKAIYSISNYISECNLYLQSENYKWYAFILLNRLCCLLESVSDEISVEIHSAALSISCLKARAFIADHEFQRASHTLSKIPTKTQLEQYLYFYALLQNYLKAELISNSNNLFTHNDTEFCSKSVNSKVLVELAAELVDLSEKNSFLHFLLAKVQSLLSNNEDSIRHCILAISLQPLNWECWCLLASLITDSSQCIAILERLNLENDFWFMLALFYLKVMSRLQDDFFNCISLIARLRSSGITNNIWIQWIEGIFYYNEREFDTAEKIFYSVIEEKDEYMLEVYDLLSNILYIKEESDRLAILTQQVYKIDSLRPESCCVAGNFWSLRQEHTFAIQQFQKAIKLDPSYLSAWVLMGHEYLELRLTSAAIECYRNALKRDPNDYRAWYGLGQTYELLKMNSYSLYYYRQAVKYKPSDSRMWSALSCIYLQLGDLENATESLAKAHSLETSDCSISLKLAKLYLKSKRHFDAITIYEQLINAEHFVSF